MRVDVGSQAMAPGDFRQMREDASRPGSLATVLLYEHHPTMRQLIRDVLEDDGYGVISVPTLEDAREIAADSTVGLFLADPLEMLRERALEQYRWCCGGTDRRVPVIILTGHDINEAEAREIGCAEVLPKPFDIDDLLRVVERNLQRDTVPTGEYPPIARGPLEGECCGAKDGSV